MFEEVEFLRAGGRGLVEALHALCGLSERSEEG